MRKCGLLLFLALLCTMLLAACGGGNVEGAVLEVGSSQVYSEAEIEAAMKIVLDHFDCEFTGCTLTRLSYEEEKSAKASGEWAAQYEADEAIVLYSSFDVDDSGGDGSLNPNSTYDHWQWILTRSDGGKWTLQTWGYG